MFIFTNNFKEIGVLKVYKFFSYNAKSRGFDHSNQYLRWHSKIPVSRPISSQSKFIMFESLIHHRRVQAQQSLLIQVQSEKSCNELYSFGSQFGPIESMHHYVLPGHNHYVIMEMKDADISKTILNQCGHLDKSQIIPIRSPFLWFRALKKKSVPVLNISNINCQTHSLFPPSEIEIEESLSKCSTLADQMMTLYDMTKMNDINSRLRFLVAYQVELALSGLFPQCVIYPFGSSVSHFGKLGCDLDLVLQLDKQTKEESNHCRLMFHCKSSMGSERSQTLRHLETIGDLLQLFLPSCSQVKRILGARVPIIKYKHDMTSLECDLSMTNLTAFYMAELLYIFGEIDWRVRPLVFTIKKWAKDVNLTNPTPGRWITNFSLTILILFYLQVMKIIPSIKVLIDQSLPSDKRLSEDGVDCTFLRDISYLNFSPSLSSDATDSLTTLLMGFFEFYSQFDFNQSGISLYTGKALPKPEYGALYINNPLERGLNVSKNVSLEELERLKNEFKNAAWILESLTDTSSQSDMSWGLLELFKKQDMSLKAKSVFFNNGVKDRLMSVESLFSEENLPQNVEDVKVSSETSLDGNKKGSVSSQTLKAVQKHIIKTKRR